jgi:transposase InsO family protein
MLTTVARCRSRSKAAIALHGAPEFIRSDNGTEFIAKELQRWLAEQKIKTLYITPASPWARRRYESLLMIARSALERDIVMDGQILQCLRESIVACSAARVTSRRDHHGA